MKSLAELLAALSVEHVKVLLTTIGGVWALWVYTATARVRKAEWLHSLYREFYLDDAFKHIRATLEFACDTDLDSLFKKALASPSSSPEEGDRETIQQLDAFLNYLELYSLFTRHHLVASYPDTGFQWWIGRFANAKPDSYMRQYIRKHFSHLDRAITPNRLSTVLRLLPRWSPRKPYRGAA